METNYNVFLLTCDREKTISANLVFLKKWTLQNGSLIITENSGLLLFSKQQGKFVCACAR